MGSNTSLQRLSAVLAIVALSLSGLWVVSGIFALPIFADALVVMLRLQPEPLLSASLGGVFVAAAVYVLWLAVGGLARAPQFAEQPPLDRALLIAAAVDLSLWAVVPLLFLSLSSRETLTYALGALLGTVGSAARRAAVQHAHPADSALGR